MNKQSRHLSELGVPCSHSKS